MEEKEIGKVASFFVHLNVAAIDLSDTMKVGDKIHIKGHTTDFEQSVESIQIDKKDVQDAKKGDSVGIKVQDRVRPGDTVYSTG